MSRPADRTEAVRTRQAPRYRVVADGDNRATLHLRGGSVRHYWAPSRGGYVRQIDERHPGTLGWQVCDGLAGSGSTLTWSPGRPLADVIRREARRYVDAIGGAL